MNNCGDSLARERGAFQPQGGGEIPTSPLQFNKLEYKVAGIPDKEAYPWFLKKHYAKICPSVITHCFGLFHNNILVGVMSYGLGGARENNNLGKFDVRELTRLVINDNLGKNACSFFISKTFKLLPIPLVLLSYSDLNFSHHGYIYQATNWIYTGESEGRNTFVDKNGKEVHEKTIWDRYHSNSTEVLAKYGFTRRKKLGKHRYFYFLGNAMQKAEMRYELLKRYKIYPYPKGDNKRYDASYKPEIQGVFF